MREEKKRETREEDSNRLSVDGIPDPSLCNYELWARCGSDIYDATTTCEADAGMWLGTKKERETNTQTNRQEQGDKQTGEKSRNTETEIKAAT